MSYDRTRHDPTPHEPARRDAARRDPAGHDPSPHDPIRAAERLAAVLQRENAALAALDLRGAARMLPEKQQAAAALLEALAGDAAPKPLQARMLADLAKENRRRLEHAIAVQGRVIGLIARAIRSAAPPAPRYGATGAITAARTGPMTFSARA